MPIVRGLSFYLGHTVQRPRSRAAPTGLALGGASLSYRGPDTSVNASRSTVYGRSRRLYCLNECAVYFSCYIPIQLVQHIIRSLLKSLARNALWESTLSYWTLDARAHRVRPSYPLDVTLHMTTFDYASFKTLDDRTPWTQRKAFGRQRQTEMSHPSNEIAMWHSNGPMYSSICIHGPSPDFSSAIVTAEQGSPASAFSPKPATIVSHSFSQMAPTDAMSVSLSSLSCCSMQWAFTCLHLLFQFTTKMWPCLL